MKSRKRAGAHTKEMTPPRGTAELIHTETRGSSFREGKMIQVKPHYWLLMSSGSEFNFYRDTGEEWSV